MITSDKRDILQKDFANLTDYEAKCPEGCKSFFTFVQFQDGSTCLWSNIFARTRQIANILVFQKFLDCMDYVTGYNLHECEY